MPIVDIRANIANLPVANLRHEIQHQGSLALSTPPSNIWILTQHLETTSAPVPPIVEIRANRGRTPAQKQAFVAVVARAVARALNMKPEEIWIHYQELDPADIWFGKPFPAE